MPYFNIAFHNVKYIPYYFAFMYILILLFSDYVTHYFDLSVFFKDITFIFYLIELFQSS